MKTLACGLTLALMLVTSLFSINLSSIVLILASGCAGICLYLCRTHSGKESGK